MKPASAATHGALEEKKKQEKKTPPSSLARGFGLTRKMHAGGLNTNGEASDVP